MLVAGFAGYRRARKGGAAARGVSGRAERLTAHSISERKDLLNARSSERPNGPPPAPIFAAGCAPRGRSERADAHQIVEMDDPDHLAALHHQKRRDLVADLLQRLGDERVRRDCAGLLGHYARDLGVEGEIRLQMTAQVAVGEDADEPVAVFEHRDAAEALRRHLDDRLGHPGARLDPRDALAGVHDVADMGEPGPELAARMKCLEIERGEAAALEE